MKYDPRLDALGALTLGGVGALSGLGYSLLNKKQRNNKLRNALIGAAVLPTTYVGGKALASLFSKNPNQSDPVYKHISKPLNDKFYALEGVPKSEEKLRQAKVNFEKSEKTPTDKQLLDTARFIADQKKGLARNDIMAAGYAPLGIGLPALYLWYLENKKKKEYYWDEDDD